MELYNIFAKLELVENVENQEIQDYNEPLKRELAKFSTEEAEPSPDNPPWNSIVAFLVWAASVLLIIIFPTVALAIYFAKNDISLTNQAQLSELLTTDINVGIIQVLAVIPAHIITLIIAWLVVTKWNRFSFKQTLGWKLNNFRFWHIALIVILFFVVAGALTSYFGEQENEFMKLLRSSRTAVLLVAFLATFTAPVVEEVIYRGILYSALQKTFHNPTGFLFENVFFLRRLKPLLREYPVALAVFIVTLLFAAVHFPQYSGDYITISMICLLSLVLTMIRVWTKNLLPCIILHFVFNGIQSVILLLEPYLPKVP